MNFIETFFGLREKYPKYLKGGIEIETCVSEDTDTTKAIGEYKPVKDGSINCRFGLKSVEYRTQNPYPLADVIDDNTDIGRNTTQVLAKANSCNLLSCSTHVHISSQLTKNENPFFGYILLYLWLNYYQPYCFALFYQHEQRVDNQYAKTNDIDDQDDVDTKSHTNETLCSTKYRMMNFCPSYIGDEWHAEFRGFGQIVTLKDKQLWKTHIQVIMNMWLQAEAMQKRILQQGTISSMTLQPKQLPAEWTPTQIEKQEIKQCIRNTTTLRQYLKNRTTFNFSKYQYQTELTWEVFYDGTLRVGIEIKSKNKTSEDFLYTAYRRNYLKVTKEKKKEGTEEIETWIQNFTTIFPTITPQQMTYEGIQIYTHKGKPRNYLLFSFIFIVQEFEPNQAFFAQVKTCLRHYLDYLFPSTNVQNKTFKEQILQNILPQSQLIQQKNIANVNIQEIPMQVAFLKFRLKRKIDTQDNKQEKKKLKF